jgi:basic amino acid/polyamine antiporter, APA family
MEKAEFKRNINLFGGIAIVAGSMIGSGIFIVSADIARLLGSPVYILLTWLLTGVITIIAALSYGELAGMMPKAGGQYIYLKEAYNPLVGFLYGWTLFLVIQTGTIAAVAVAFAKFAGVLIPQLSENIAILSIFGFQITMAQVVAVGSIVLLTFVNYRGIKYGKVLQVGFTIAKLSALSALIILGFIMAFKSNYWTINFTNMWNATTTVAVKNTNLITLNDISFVALIATIGVAMVGAIFSNDAWNNVTFVSAEIKNPAKNVPLSLFWGVFIVTIVYILANIAYLGLLPIKGSPNATDVIGHGIQFASSDRVGVAAASQIFGESAAIIMAALIMISTFGANNGLILSGARVYYAMANDGLFFKNIAKINKYSVPGIALVIQCIWASVLCISGKYSDLLDYVVFAVLLFYVLTVTGLFILRIKKPNLERPYKAFGYPVLPAMYIIIAIAICVDLLIFKPTYTWPGIIIVAFGIPVYFLMNGTVVKNKCDHLDKSKY